MALETVGLLREQLDAQVIHYRADLETNAELDAITAGVVEQLRQMQQAVQSSQGDVRSAAEIERDQIALLSRLLHRQLGAERAPAFIAAQIKPIARRAMKLFFESELHEKTKGDRDRVIRHPEQGLYYVLSRYRSRLRADLESFDYDESELREQTIALLEKTERELQNAFLSRRSPELKRVLTDLTLVLTEFFEKRLPPELATLARSTIEQSGSARQPTSVAYKIHGAAGFAAFRAIWESELVTRLVAFCPEALMARIQENDELLLDETIAFFTDPHLLSEIAEVVCLSIYDTLCQDGFLDLPLDWRLRLQSSD